MLRGRFPRFALCVVCVTAAVPGCGSDSKPVRPDPNDVEAGAAGAESGAAAGSGGGGNVTGKGGSSGASGSASGENPGGNAGSGGKIDEPGGAPGSGSVFDGGSAGSSGVGGTPDEGAGGAADAGRGGEPSNGGDSGAAGSTHEDPGGTSGAGGAAGSDADGGSAPGGAPQTEGGSAGASGADSDAGESGAGGDTQVWIEPILTDLVVTGAQVPLKPAFSPERTRYSFVPRSSGASPEVSATAAEGLALRIAGMTASSGESVSLASLAPGSAFDVEVTNASGASRSYNVQYLPSGFPDVRVTVAEPGASQDPIYVNLKRGVGGSTASYVTKLDNAGVPLFYLSESIDTYDFKKHVDGYLSYARGRENTEHVVLDPLFVEVARVKTVGLVNTDVHDFHILPNGHRILMAYERTDRDLTPYGGASSFSVQDAVLQEIDQLGGVVFQWSSWEALPYDQSLYPNAADYAHVNSIELANDGNWLVSVRGFSQVIKLDRTSGAILWRLGGIANEFTFLDDPLGSFCGQHTVSQLESGNILIFDNGTYCWPEAPAGRVTRVVEYEIDEVLKTARLVWSYTRPSTNSAAQGSAQRLANGNTFIGWGSNTNVLATEVDPLGTTVYEVQATSNRGGFVSYRARRFAD